MNCNLPHFKYLESFCILIKKSLLFFLNCLAQSLRHCRTDRFYSAGSCPKNQAQSKQSQGLDIAFDRVRFPDNGQVRTTVTFTRMTFRLINSDSSSEFHLLSSSRLTTITNSPPFSFLTANPIPLPLLLDQRESKYCLDFA